MEDDEIKALMIRLGRRHPSGGSVVERAAILAEGVDVAAVMVWIEEHDGTPEAAVTSVSAGRGLHADRADVAAAARTQAPLRYVLPAAALA